MEKNPSGYYPFDEFVDEANCALLTEVEGSLAESVIKERTRIFHDELIMKSRKGGRRETSDGGRVEVKSDASRDEESSAEKSQVSSNTGGADRNLVARDSAKKSSSSMAGPSARLLDTEANVVEKESAVDEHREKHDLPLERGLRSALADENDNFEDSTKAGAAHGVPSSHARHLRPAGNVGSPHDVESAESSFGRPQDTSVGVAEDLDRHRLAEASDQSQDTGTSRDFERLSHISKASDQLQGVSHDFDRQSLVSKASDHSGSRPSLSDRFSDAVGGTRSRGMSNATSHVSRSHSHVAPYPSPTDVSLGSSSLHEPTEDTMSAGVESHSFSASPVGARAVKGAGAVREQENLVAQLDEYRRQATILEAQLNENAKAAQQHVDDEIREKSAELEMFLNENEEGDAVSPAGSASAAQQSPYFDHQSRLPRKPTDSVRQPAHDLPPSHTDRIQPAPPFQPRQHTDSQPKHHSHDMPVRVHPLEASPSQRLPPSGRSPLGASLPQSASMRGGDLASSVRERQQPLASADSITELAAAAAATRNKAPVDLPPIVRQQPPAASASAAAHPHSHTQEQKQQRAQQPKVNEGTHVILRFLFFDSS